MKFILDKYYKKTRGFYPFFKYCPDIYKDYYLKKRAFDTMGYEYNWKEPKTLNEKIRWLIFNEKLDLKTKLTDKILVKSYIAQKIGKNHSAELYGIYNSFDEIDFSILPENIAIKANSGWRMNIFIQDKNIIKTNYNKFKTITKKWLTTDYSLFTLEPQYKQIKRKLLIERLRPFDKRINRCDIQVYCFNGEPTLIEIPTNKEDKTYYQFFDTCWNLQNFTYGINKTTVPLTERPERLDEIFSMCKKLSAEFSFVRIDFSFDEEDIHVVEMTFTPCGAIIPFKNQTIDFELGELLDINKI